VASPPFATPLAVPVGDSTVLQAESEQRRNVTVPVSAESGSLNVACSVGTALTCAESAGAVGAGVLGNPFAVGWSIFATPSPVYSVASQFVALPIIDVATCRRQSWM
jgi:hypothetical protein